MYVGKIDEDGSVVKNLRTVLEYGNSYLLMTIVNELESPLRSCFPERYMEIMASGIIRNLG